MARQIELNANKPKPIKKRKVVSKSKSKPGAGDIIEAVTKATGIKKVVEVFSLITGVDCGCEQRKEALNNLFRRKKLKPRCITRDEYHQINTVLTSIKTQIKPAQQREIARLYSTVFGTRYEVWCDVCPGIWRDRMDELRGVVDVYRNELEKQEA